MDLPRLAQLSENKPGRRNPSVRGRNWKIRRKLGQEAQDRLGDRLKTINAGKVLRPSMFKSNWWGKPVSQFINQQKNNAL